MNMHRRISARARTVSRLLALIIALPSAPVLSAADYLGPDAVVAAKDGKSLYITCRDSQQLLVVDVASRSVARKIDLPAKPTGIALNSGGTRLYVTCAVPRGVICVIDTAEQKIVSSIGSSAWPTAPVVAPDGTRLFVCNRFENNFVAIDLTGGKEIARVPAPREPYCAAATPDGKTIFTADLLPCERADGDNVAAVILAVDAATQQATTIRLPVGGSIIRGMCVSPDGKYVYAVHVMARYQLPTSQVERGWSNTAALSVIDVAAKKLVNTIALDDVDLGAADPWDVATTADGKRICVTHAGTHELSVIDAPGLFAKLARCNAAPSAAAEVPYDLAFLVDLRRRIKLEGNGPHGLAVIGSTACVAEYFSDSLAVVELTPDAPKPVERIALGPAPKLTIERRGKILFNDATLCFQQWQSCASCHPDARMDGMNWDLLNDGLGNPKNTRSLIKVHESGAVMALAERDTAKAAIRAGIRVVMYADRPDADSEAIDEYLRSLSPVPSPRLLNGEFSPAALRGRKIFFDRGIGCARCHPEPYYTDKRAHDIGSLGPMDKPSDRFQTPRLVELWRTAPYLHDGRYLTVKELLVEGKHGGMKGELDRLSDADIDDLVEFLLSL
jgi:YVTN family beta-propeller protein